MFYLILDNIRSLHNVGAMFRTADGVGITKIFLCGITGFPPRSEIDKTSLGAHQFVEWEYSQNILDVLSKLKVSARGGSAFDGKKLNIISLEQTEHSKNYLDVDYEFPLALVVGNEVNGVQEKILKMSDEIIHIPMHGKKESLNVATAAGIALYKIREKYSY